MSWRDRMTIFWGYAIEIIASTVVHGIAITAFGIPAITAFVQETCDEWNDLSGILFSAALAVWLTFIIIRGSLFGEYLAKHRSDDVYSRAFLTSMIVFFLMTVAMIFARGIKSNIVAHVSLWLLIYSFLNLYSMIKNSTDIIRLYSAFKRGLDTERIRIEANNQQQATKD